jgi:glutaconate CoA-transferase subunit B
MSLDFTRSEIQIASMARVLKGEIIAAGATLLADLATKVAKVVYDDDLLLSPGGSFASLDSDVIPTLGHDEHLDRLTARGQYDWSLAFDLIAADKFRIFTGPAQIDRSGAANISVVGDWHRPKVQLIGSRGLPDDVWRIKHIHFHLPKQSKRNLVQAVDFVSSFGNGPIREEIGCVTGRPGVLVTDLAVFYWPNDGDIAVQSIHPGVSVQELQEHTGFDLALSDAIATTVAPTPEELHAIRHIVDPDGTRDG